MNLAGTSNNNLYDRLIDYIEDERSSLRSKIIQAEVSNSKNLPELRGRYSSLLDILSFLMSDGKLR